MSILSSSRLEPLLLRLRLYRLPFPRLSRLTLLFLGGEAGDLDLDLDRDIDLDGLRAILCLGSGLALLRRLILRGGGDRERLRL